MEQLSLNDYSAASAALPMIAAAINFRHIDRVLVVAVFYFLAAALFELILMLSMRAGLANNMPLIHLFIALSLSLFSVLYYRAFQSKTLQRLVLRSEEHTSELQSLMRISYAVFCLKKKKYKIQHKIKTHTQKKTQTKLTTHK